MIRIRSGCNGDPAARYALKELERVLRIITAESVSIMCECGGNHAEIDSKKIQLNVDASLEEDEISIDSTPCAATLAGGSPGALLHAVYDFLERLGCSFEFSGEILPRTVGLLSFPACSVKHRPSFRERGIRLHLNFVQDQSFFTEPEFEAFIDNMARMKWNYVIFHMYTPQQWFPFQFRGIKHLDLALGNLERRSLAPDMIGRDKVHVHDHWFPKEFETLTDPELLMLAMYGRYRRMMARAKERGIRVCVSLEPESVPESLANKDMEDIRGLEDKGTQSELVQDWQVGWSGKKLADLDVRDPLLLEIAVERCLQCIEAFPELDELQLISREGTAWRPAIGESYQDELDRLQSKFSLDERLFDREELSRTVPVNDRPEMNPRAHPYWTVLPGNDNYPTVLGALRFVELALAVYSDSRMKIKLEERKLATSVAIYSPNPNTVRLMLPAVSAMLPERMRYQSIGDYGAKDIADQLIHWEPLRGKQRIGVISWLEFDGTMMLAQSWMDSIVDNVRKAYELGAETITFNHWRVRSLEHNAAAAAASAWDQGIDAKALKSRYFSKLYGAPALGLANRAYAILEEATIYSKSRNYNVGFTSDWVFHNSTEPPGYHWSVLQHSADLYESASDAFTELAAFSSELGMRQAAYMADMCKISSLHLWAVHHLQLAKLPLVGFKAWPLGNPHAAWPAPELLSILIGHAETSLQLEKQFMRMYSKWVESSDEMGQLSMHHQGVIEPIEGFINEMRTKLGTGAAVAAHGVTI